MSARLVFVTTDGQTIDPISDAVERACDEVGVRFVRAQIPASSMSKHDPDPGAHVEWLARVVDHDATGGPLTLSGFSFGARVAVAACNSLDVRSLVLVGFPFHARGDFARTQGLDGLQQITRPTLVVQGERDAHGDRKRIGAQSLPDDVSVFWLADANHRLVPRARSGVTAAEHLAEATAEVARFLRSARPTRSTT